MFAFPFHSKEIFFISNFLSRIFVPAANQQKTPGMEFLARRLPFLRGKARPLWALIEVISKRLHFQVGYFPQAEVRVMAASHEAREAFSPPLPIRKETEGLPSGVPFYQNKPRNSLGTLEELFLRLKGKSIVYGEKLELSQGGHEMVQCRAYRRRLNHHLHHLMSSNRCFLNSRLSLRPS